MSGRLADAILTDAMSRVSLLRGSEVLVVARTEDNEEEEEEDKEKDVILNYIHIILYIV